MASKNVQFAIEGNNRSAMAALGQVEKGVAHLSERVTGPFADALAGIASFEGIKMLTESVIELGDEFDKAAKRIETTTDNVQALDKIARHSGGELETMEKGLNKIEQAAQAALGGDRIKKTIFDSLGISQQDLQHLNKVDLLSKVSQGSQKLDTASRDQTFSDLFGEKLGPTLQAASEELAHMSEIKDKMKASGEIMSNEEIQKLVEMKDAWKDMTTSIEVKMAPAITTVEGVIESFVNNVIQLVELFGTALGAFATVISTVKPVELIKSFGDNMVNSIKALFSNLGSLIRGKKSIGDVFDSLEQQESDNVQHSLEKGFDANAVDAAFQTINEKILEFAEQDKAKALEKAARANQRAEQQAKAGGDVNRKGTITGDNGTTDKLASPGNVAIGGTAAVDYRFRVARTNEQIRDILKQILDEIRKNPSAFKFTQQTGYAL